MNKNFAIIGVAGYIAPRHLQAIEHVGGKIIAAVDPNTSVGILDRYSIDAKFFTNTEELGLFLKSSMQSEDKKINWLSICSPNYLHLPHIAMGLSHGLNVICEKPLVLSPEGIDYIKTLECKYAKKVYTILQLRLLDILKSMKQKIDNDKNQKEKDVVLTYITPRGQWYEKTWKINIDQSGGIGTNIGIHLFDLMLWFFGEPLEQKLHIKSYNKMSGVIKFNKAKVRWFLSSDINDLQKVNNDNNANSYREILIDGEKLEFSNGFTDLHNLSYEKIFNNEGFGIDFAKPAVSLVCNLRYMRIFDEIDKKECHPFAL